MLILSILINILASIRAGPVTEPAYKDQYCTDPRTMRKHVAYTEWADAYSCTRHRCQPGGRNLAIYTVGCKRVEAPESAIECEEVVEDTNMQFPYCCTRLRCLVVVRGEVWTRVLGQPWETLPAAPWSHMYKMKKPPPGDTNFLPKSPGEGPVYELQTEPDSDGGHDKVLRASLKGTTERPDCNEIAPRANGQGPDIVIALSTANDRKDEYKKTSTYKHKRARKTGNNLLPFVDEEVIEPKFERNDARVEEPEDAVIVEKPLEPTSEEKYYSPPVTPKNVKHQVWTEIPANQWNEQDPSALENVPKDTYSPYSQQTIEDKKEDKPPNLQALVDAIGTRMRDIETVVQRMSEKVIQDKQALPDAEASAEKRMKSDSESRKHTDPAEVKVKKSSPSSENYKRFLHRSSKYLRTLDITTEPPGLAEDNALNNYYDATNSDLKRNNVPKEPAATYMAPVENRRKTRVVSEEDTEKKRKKHVHKKKKPKGHHKKHHKDEKRKKTKNSLEVDPVTQSLEDSSIAGN